MKKITLILTIIIVCIITSASTDIVLNKITKKSTNIIDMAIKVDEKYGFNLDKDSLHFASVPPGSSSSRLLSFEGKDKEQIVSINATGEIAQWITYSKNNFKILPDENINITITAKVPSNIEMKKYDGKLLILNKRLWI